MAVYDYRCSDVKCSSVFEVQHKMSESPETVCPECGAVSCRLFGGDVPFIWNTSYGTRGFGRSKNAPRLEGQNIGHNPPTLGQMGLSESEGASLGIK
jgi:putative FmdB family regulatory protein